MYCQVKEFINHLKLLLVMVKQELIDKVVEQVKEDIYAENTTILEELFVALLNGGEVEECLKAYLPE